MKWLLYLPMSNLYIRLYKSVEKIENNLEQNMTNKVNIERLQKDVEKMLIDIEKLKDADREIKNGH